MIAFTQFFKAESVERFDDIPQVSIMAEVCLGNSGSIESIDIAGLKKAVRQAAEKFCKVKQGVNEP